MLRLRRLALLLAALAPAAGAQQALEPDRDDGVPPGWMIIEGDIQVPQDFYLSPSPFATNFWPGGDVPYVFHSSVGAGRQALAIAAMEEWETQAHLDFHPRNGEPNYIVWRDSGQNSSAIGMIPGGQTINIVSWNTHYTIMHEIGHALGYWHTHASEDRDQYVQINYDNVCQTCCGGSCNGNFNIIFGSKRYGPYNFDSFMHYGQFQASGNGMETITVLPPNDVEWQDVIGQRDHMSVWDGRLMSFLYPEPDWLFVDWSDATSTETGEFFDPYLDFWQAVNAVPTGGQVIVKEPDPAIAPGTIDRAMTLRAPMGGVVIR